MMMRIMVELVLAVMIGARLAAPPAVHAQEMGTPAATPAAAATAEVYLIIANSGCMPDQLIGTKTDVTDSVEIHESTKDGDAVEMRPLPDGLTVLAGRTVRLEPGGDHLMLIGLREDLMAGDTFLLTLSFLYTGDVSVPVTVRGDVTPSAEETPPAPVSIGTIRVSDAWMQAAVSPSGTPAAVES